MIIKNTPHNQCIKYAWLRYKGYTREEARILCQRVEMPEAFYQDLDSYFFYVRGKLVRDVTDGSVNNLYDILLTRSFSIVK